MNYRFWGLVFLLAIFSCNRENRKGSEGNTLFRLLGPKQTGITFKNNLTESDSDNAIFYEYYYNGSGLAAGDLNNDGLSDLVFGANMTRCSIWLNKGNLKFIDITDQCGLNTSGKWITGVCLVDINQDGWLDIYLSAAGNINYDYHNLLYISNGDKDHLQFTECASKAGLDDDGYTTQAEFFDYDLDGDLDVYLVTAAMKIPNKNALRQRKNDGSMINTDRLYRNDGINPETGLPVFHNVSAEAGITWDGFGLGAAVLDINRDGWPDIYVGNDYISNDLLYVNQRDGTFRESLADYFNHTSNSTMGVDASDFNNDGLVDIVTLDMLPEDYYRKRVMALGMRTFERYEAELKAGYSPQYIRNMLQMNDGLIEGRYRFSEIGQLAGIYETDWSWAPLFADFDNDGFKDLFIGNGIPEDVTNMDVSELWMKTVRGNPSIEFPVLYRMLKTEMGKKGNVKKPNCIFRNSGGHKFENKTIEWGFGEPTCSTGSVFSDLDNDGDLDIVVNNVNDFAGVYENTTINADSLKERHHFLEVVLSGDSPNKDGIGASIYLYYNGRQQYYEHFPVRGFQSMIDPRIHFGIGDAQLADSLKIRWPDGKVQMLYNITANRTITLRHSEAASNGPSAVMEDKRNRIFSTATASLKLQYKHEEKEFSDFDIQPLLLHRYSQEGPGIAVGDANNDGMDDFFVGGSTGYSGKFFIQKKDGTFSANPLPGNNNYEDMGSLFFDADGDGDQDLYVVSGGTGLPPGNQFYNDRLYINDGTGKFTMDKNSIPDERVCGSHVTAADFDRDGDLDLFVCGRVSLEKYPLPPRSFLLRNDSKPGSVRFTDVTSSVCRDLENPGLLASALWTDFNRDSWPDLIIAGEWMPLTVFENRKGMLVNVTPGSGLENYTGWWNSIAAADFDYDGDMDYVCGNLGVNTQYKVSREQPMRITAADIDLNGTLDPVISSYVQGKNYPVYQRNQFLLQVPSLRNRFKTYDDYARATLEDIIPKSSLKDAYIKECSFFETAWIENTGNGKFAVHPLPDEAQTAPVYGILTDDFDGDGKPDILMSGNSWSPAISDGQYDAFTGLYLKGNGDGSFRPVVSRESGFFVNGDAKALAEITLAGGESYVLASRNSDSLKVIKSLSNPLKVIRLKDDETCAELKYKDGKTRFIEFYRGSGYLSQSSGVCKIPAGAGSVIIFGFNGESRTISIKE